MAASINDKLRKVYQSFSTTLASQKAAAASTMSLSSASGIPTTTAIDFTVGRVDSGGTRTPSAKAVYKGTLSGTTVSNLTLIEGTDQLHAAGTVVEITWTASTWNDAVDHLLTEHNQNGTHSAVTATSVTASGTVQGATVVATGDIQHRSVSLETIRSESVFDHIASGCVLSGTGYGATLAWSLTPGVVYIGGKRLTVAAATGTVTASRDTYFDLLDPGSGTVATLVNTGGNIVTNNAASPALAASSTRLGIIVSGATNIASVASVNQGEEIKVLPIASSAPYAVTDSLGNLICPRDPLRRILGYRQQISNQATTSTSPVQLTGVSVPVIVPAGRKIRLTLQAFSYNAGVNDGYITSIWDGSVGGGTSLQSGGMEKNSNPNATSTPAVVVVTPTTSSKTYNGGFRSSVGGSANTNCTAVSPLFLMVELI